MTTQDVLDLVHAQRTLRGVDKVCRGWTDAQLLQAVNDAILNNAFGWVELEGKLAGFAFGIPRQHERVLDVTQVVCSSSRALAHLLLTFSSTYAGWSIRGLRKKKGAVITYKKQARFERLMQTLACKNPVGYAKK